MKLIYNIFKFNLGYVFEAYDHTNNRKVALKRIEKVGEQLSREFEILFDIKDCNNIVKIVVIFFFFLFSFFYLGLLGFLLFID